MCDKPNNFSKYIFWLYGWSNKPGLPSYSNLYKCQISNEQLQILSKHDFHIQISSIRECKDILIGRYINAITAVELSLTNNEVWYLFPANPFKPADYVSQTVSEVLAFVSVINSIQEGNVITLNPNPYERELNSESYFRKGKYIGKEWDANKSPFEYFPKTPWHVTFSRAIVGGIGGFIVFLLLLLTILWLLGKVTITFS